MTYYNEFMTFLRTIKCMIFHEPKEVQSIESNDIFKALSLKKYYCKKCDEYFISDSTRKMNRQHSEK